MSNIRSRSLVAATFVAALLVPSLGAAQSFSGAYLAARQAQIDNDYATAADYFSAALARDPSNVEIMEDLILSHVAQGDIARAAIIARKLEADGMPSQIGQLALGAVSARDGDFAALIERVEAGKHMGDLVDGLVLGWAHVGEGDMDAALAAFDKVMEANGTRAFGMLHKALALAHVGDYDGAVELFASAQPGSLMQSRRGVIAQIEVLSLMGRGEDAAALLKLRFGDTPDPELSAMRSAIAAGETLKFNTITSPLDGISEVYYTIAGALSGEPRSTDTLLFARLSQFLKPEHVDASLLLAQLLESQGQFEAATAAYRSVPQDHPSFHVAELGRSETLRQAGKTDTAIEVLEQLRKTHGQLAIVHSAMGDLLRSDDRYSDAIKAYDRAIEISGENSTDWRTFYTRGISYERTDNWPAAEADFRRALQINPGQPSVLNYLGYSLVEKQLKLDEALEMIEQAVAARPESGYIIDSLGWALFRLGRFEEAVPHMERAAELMSIDPVVNDHLGDVYWAVGRKLEAEFQWRRALSFIDQGELSEDADAERIKRKLEVGLDQVLEEEGAKPLELMANDGG